MKRDRDRGKGEAAECGGAADEKGKMWAAKADAGMDELFAVLGYKVKSSDMADVAEKLEQWEIATMGNTTAMEDGDDFGGAASVLSTDTVHYNPSDLCGWVESMLTELNNYDAVNPTPITVPDESPAPAPPTDVVVDDDDLRAIPRQAILKIDLANDSPDWSHKRVKPSAGSEIGESAAAAAPPRPVVVLDSQETGVRLVHTLMACAEAIQKDNMNLADALVKHIGALAVSQIGAMRKVATYFAEALARKIYNIHPVDTLPSDDLQMHFFETAPYLKFAHFTSNQAIFEAFTGAAKVHVIDFSLKQGMQWPALLQVLACRPAGQPGVRLTGIGIKPENPDGLNQVGQKLHQFAELIGIHKFEFRGIVVDSLADLDSDMLEIRTDETLAVNSVFELHQLLARPGAIDHVLSTVKYMNPKVITIVEQEANHNVDIFLDRFNEALHYYSTMFDSLESGGILGASSENLVMSEVYLGRQICNVVACDGEERVERHETLRQWQGRMSRAGYEAAHLGSSAYKQVSMLLAMSASGDGYSVEEKEGCLMLGWHTRPLIATSAWRLPRQT